jgi:hypothetical protein
LIATRSVEARRVEIKVVGKEAAAGRVDVFTVEK